MLMRVIGYQNDKAAKVPEKETRVPTKKRESNIGYWKTVSTQESAQQRPEAQQACRSRER